jgi:hypothetical protein
MDKKILKWLYDATEVSIDRIVILMMKMDFLNTEKT